MKSLIAVGVFLCLTVALQKQESKNDMLSVTTAGKVNGDTYQNSYLGISLSAPKGKWEVRGPISLEGRQGRLIDAVYDSGKPERGPDENYTLGLLVESVQNFPKGTSAETYLRNVRHRLEGGNLKTVQEEFPLVVSDTPFIGTVFQFFEKSNFGYYRGLYSTMLNDYFVTIEVQCGRKENLEKWLSSAVKINPPGKAPKAAAAH